MQMDTRIPMMAQNPNPLQAYTSGISAADAVNQINQKQAYQNFITQSGEALYQGDEAALQRYAAFDPEGAFALRGQFEQRAAQQQARARASSNAAASAQQTEQNDQIKQVLSIMDTAYDAGPEEFAKVAETNGLTATLSEYNAGYENYHAASAGLRERVGYAAQVMPETPKPQTRQVTGDEAKAMGLDPAKVYNVAPDGKVTGIGAASTSISIDTGDKNVDFGNPDTGYVWAYDKDGNIATQLDESGEYYQPVQIPKAGGDVESEQEAEAAASDLKEEIVERAGGIVTEDIGRALDIVEQDPQWTTGVGAVLKFVPGTEAKSLAGILQTVKANIGFDRLQQMRDSSVTGGALGAINKTEMDLLQAVLGNLEQSLDAEDLAYNLNRVNRVYMDIIHGKGEWTADKPTELTDEQLFEKYNQ